MCGATFECNGRSECPIGHPKRMFGRIGIGLSSQNCRIEPYRYRKSFILGARHAAEWSRKPQVDGFETHGLSVFCAGIFQAATKLVQLRLGVFDPLPRLFQIAFACSATRKAGVYI